MLTFKIQARTDQTNKDGLSQIYIRVYSDSKENKFNLPLKVELKHFDVKENKARSSMSNYTYVNVTMGQFKQKAEVIIHEYTINNLPLPFVVFRDRMLGEEKSTGGGDFFEFIKKRLAQSNFSHNTQRSYITLYNLLYEYSPKLTFSDLTYNFIIGFRNFLHTEKDNVENSSNKKMKQLGALINEAMKQDLMIENPAKKIKLRNIMPHRDYLELHEVENLQTLYDQKTLKDQEQNVLRYFLFSCYTGLRFSDVEQFNVDMIINGKISIVAEKTKETMTIPLLPQAKALLPKREKQFRVISNQKTNAALKRIMEVAEINKPVSSHTARHSFATISTSSGIRMEVISKILGHTNLKTTMIYAKIMDDVKVEEMKLWGKKK